MKASEFQQMEAYMRTRMNDSAHDADHVYRVLYSALDIARTEPEADTDVLIAACLLHDICRIDQFADPAVCHARAGAILAQKWLAEQGYPENFTHHVGECIRTHRFRSSDLPASLEAKILFDADKIDVCGAMGIARTLMYKGRLGHSLDNPEDENNFEREYHYKLEKQYDRFFTNRGKEIAFSRRQAAVSFFNSLMEELKAPETMGRDRLEQLLK